MDFTKLDYNTIATGVNSDGVKYLQLFLIEYNTIFPGTVNPSCSKCLQGYITKYKKAMSKNDTHPDNSGYKLKAMYEGIPLEFGSQIMVTNANLTDDYAKVLLSHDDGKRFFSTIPEAILLTGREKLQADYDAAKKAFDELPEKVHHATKKKVESTLENAEEALQKYDAENTDGPDVAESADNIEVTEPENVE